MTNISNPVVGETIRVPVKSAWTSKINWAQGLSLLASILVVFGIDLEPKTQVEVVAGIQGVQAVLTWVIRTWFTKDVVASSV